MKSVIAFGLSLALLARLPAQAQTDYGGTWLNTDAYAQGVTQVNVYTPNGSKPVVYLRRESRWSVQEATIQPRFGNGAPSLILHVHTASATETYLLQRQPNGQLRVQRYVVYANAATQLDTLWFGRSRIMRRKLGLARRLGPAETDEFRLTFNNTVRPSVSPLLLTYKPQ